MPGRSQPRREAREPLKICCSLLFKRKGVFQFPGPPVLGKELTVGRDTLVCQARVPSFQPRKRPVKKGTCLRSQRRGQKCHSIASWLTHRTGWPRPSLPLPHMATEQLAARSSIRWGLISQHLGGDGQSPSPLVCFDGWGVPEVGATHHGASWDCKGTQSPLGCAWRFTPPASPIPLLPFGWLMAKKEQQCSKCFLSKSKQRLGLPAPPPVLVTDVLFQQMQKFLGSSQARTRRKPKGEQERAMAAGGPRGGLLKASAPRQEPSLASGTSSSDQQGKWPR